MMNKILKTIVLISFIIGNCGLFAQLNNDHAKEDLQTLANKYKAYTSIKINYAYTSEKNGKTVPITRGILVFKGTQYKMTIGNQEIYCDGKTIWTYLKAEKEVSIYPYEENNDDLMNPIKILSNWEKKYNAKFIREEFLEGRKLRIIDLTPIYRQSYYKIRLYVDMASKEIAKTWVYEKDSTILKYMIEKLEVNSNYTNSFFTFNTSQYKDIQINDMR